MTQLKETVYSPLSELSNFKLLFSNIIKGFVDGKSLARQLFIRNKKAMYRQSVFGLLWAFLPPIATAAIWIFLRGNKVVDFGPTEIPYPVYVFSGIMLWQIFVESVQSPLRTIQSARSILVKLNFPRESLILASFYDVMFNSGIKLLILLAFLVINLSIPTFMIVFAPIAILSLVFMGLAIGILLTPLGLLYTDIQKGLQIIFQFLIFMLPVIYPLSKGTGMAYKINVLNPVTPLLMNARNWLTNGEIYDLNSFIIVSLIAVFMLLFSVVIYRISISHLVERMGS